MKLKYLKTFEGYKLEPHRNYDEREILRLKKIIELLKNNKNIYDIIDIKTLPIKSLYNLEMCIKLDISGNKTLKSLNNLIYIQDDLFANFSNIKDLGELKLVEGVVYLDNTKHIKNLTKLKHISDDLSIVNSNIESLYPLKYCGNDIYAYDSKLKDIGDLNLSNFFGTLYLSKNHNIPKELLKNINYKID